MENPHTEVLDCSTEDIKMRIQVPCSQKYTAYKITEEAGRFQLDEEMTLNRKIIYIFKYLNGYSGGEKADLSWWLCRAGLD